MAKKKSSVAAIGIGYRLSSHERLCAERMKQLVKSIDDLNKKVSKLTEDVSKGKGGVAVLMALGAIVIGVLGYFNFK
jgi:phage terminase large subunit-like protein